jgi:hypothetical protein
MNPLIGEIKAGIGGLGEAISLADDLEGVAKQVGELGQKELAARQAWRRKRVQVSGDYAFVDAVDEYHRVREALDMKAELKRQAIAKWGPSAWHEIELIEARQKEDYAKIYTEDGHDRAAMSRLKWMCTGAAAIITFILWQSCMLPMEILIASGCGR